MTISTINKTDKKINADENTITNRQAMHTIDIINIPYHDGHIVGNDNNIHHLICYGGATGLMRIHYLNTSLENL